MDFHTDLTNLVFADESFDLIICSHVLEHIPDDGAALAEMHRVLSLGGTAYLQVPYNRTAETDEDLTVKDPKERKRRFGQSDHVRRYGIGFTVRLAEAGFRVTEEYFAREFGPSDTVRYGLWDDVIFCCLKNAVLGLPARLGFGVVAK